LYYYRHHGDRISTNHRLEQIYWAGKAVNEALLRRGLQNKLYLNIETKISLIDKASNKVCAV
jgi:hypothetical protein